MFRAKIKTYDVRTGKNHMGTEIDEYKSYAEAKRQIDWENANPRKGEPYTRWKIVNAPRVKSQTNMFGMPRLSTKGQLPKLFR